MDLDFDKALDGLRNTIPTYDFSNFASKDTVPPKAQHVLASVLFGKVVQDMEVDFNMTTREKAVFGCLKAEHAQDFLLAIPIDGLGQHMSLVEYHTILKYRLMIPLFPKDEVCPVCTTRNIMFSCEFGQKIRRKLSCGFRFSAKTFVGNCFLRFYKSAGNFPAEFPA
jgi:hypothetical protein